MNKPYEHPDYVRIFDILQTAKVDAANVATEIIRENYRLQVMVDCMVDELEKSSIVDPVIEQFLDLVGQDIEWQEQNIMQPSKHVQEIIALYRELRPKEG